MASYSISSEAPSWEFSGGRHTFGLSSCFCCVFVGFCCAPSPPAIIIASSSSSSSSSPSEADESVTSSPTTVYPPSSSSSSSELVFFSSSKSSSLPSFFFFFFFLTKFDGNRGILIYILTTNMSSSNTNATTRIKRKRTFLRSVKRARALLLIQKVTPLFD